MSHICRGKLQHRSDQELFTIDVTGDELRAFLRLIHQFLISYIILSPKVQKRVQRVKKPLRFLQILQQRSAIPAIYSRLRPSDSVKSKKLKLSREEKSKLQKARRLRRDALNSCQDPTEHGSVVAEPRISGRYDVWEKEGSDEERLVKKMKTDEAREYVLPVVKKPKVKVSPGCLLHSFQNNI